jgi:hypothetical protein
MDLKAFYENDQRLSSEIELLQKTNESQQITLNSLNSTLHYIIQNLKLTDPVLMTNPDVDCSVNMEKHDTEMVNDVVNDCLTDTDTDTNVIIDGSIPPNFPDNGRSVIINEVANEIREFSQMDEDEDGSEFVELENPSVD